MCVLFFEKGIFLEYIKHYNNAGLVLKIMIGHVKTDFIQKPVD